jgi:hypothetical protein
VRFLRAPILQLRKVGTVVSSDKLSLIFLHGEYGWQGFALAVLGVIALVAFNKADLPCEVSRRTGYRTRQRLHVTTKYQAKGSQSENGMAHWAESVWETKAGRSMGVWLKPSRTLNQQ